MSSEESRDATAVERSNEDVSIKDLQDHHDQDPEDIAVLAKEDSPPEGSQEKKPLSVIRLILIGTGLWLAVFLYSLDQTIISNAIPTITDQFKSTSDEGWYGSAYLLTTAAFQLFYGRIYSNFSLKYTFLVAIAIFEIGSLVCALAPTSTALIVGRAVAGIGSAGITSGAIILITHTFPAKIRPMCIASIGIVYAVAAVLGPILGGVFTSDLTWRWTFWINLPFGGVTVLTVFLFLPDPKRPELSAIPVVERLKKIDLVGLLIFIPAVVCLLLALQWGGEKFPWSNGRIIALLVLFGILTIAFLAYEYWEGENASLPIRIIMKRSVAAGTLNGFCNLAAFMLLIYYIPYWQQVVRGQSAVNAGVDMLPFVLGVVIMANLSGALVTKFGFYAPMMILSSIITPIGIGLITTWTVNTGSSKWIGYQVLAGLGLGLGQQQPIVAMQTVLPKPQVPAGVSIILLVQTLSGAIFISVGQSVLQINVVKRINAAFPNGGFNASSLATVGATQVRSLVPPPELHQVLVAYNGALVQVFTIALIMSCLTIIGSVSIEWRSARMVKE